MSAPSIPNNHNQLQENEKNKVTLVGFGIQSGEVYETNALHLDIDGCSERRINEIFERLTDHEFFAWTTWSHTPLKQHWAIVLPIPFTLYGKAEFDRVFRRLLDLVGEEGIDLKGCGYKSRAFVPSCPASRYKYARTKQNTGVWFL